MNDQTGQPKPKAAVDDLLGDLDAFSKKLEEDEAAAKKADEAERAAQQAAEEANRRAELERQRAAAEAQAKAQQAAAPKPAPRGGALDALRKQSASLGSRPDPAVQRASAMLALNQDMRATYSYLAEFAKEVNAVGPASNGPYQFQYLGKLATVTLGQTWVDSRPCRIEGSDYTATISMRYTVAPLPPLALPLYRDDIPTFGNFLAQLKADFDFKVEQKNDFGQPLRGVLTVKGKLPCEVEMRADYDAMAVIVDTLNLRRPGKGQCRIPAAAMKDIADELARYMLGADEDFGKRLYG
jgi:hypothetical protein